MHKVTQTEWYGNGRFHKATQFPECEYENEELHTIIPTMHSNNVTYGMPTGMYYHQQQLVAPMYSGFTKQTPQAIYHPHTIIQSVTNGTSTTNRPGSIGSCEEKVQTQVTQPSIPVGKDHQTTPKKVKSSPDAIDNDKVSPYSAARLASNTGFLPRSVGQKEGEGPSSQCSSTQTTVPLAEENSDLQKSSEVQTTVACQGHSNKSTPRKTPNSNQGQTMTPTRSPAVTLGTPVPEVSAQNLVYNQAVVPGQYGHYPQGQYVMTQQGMMYVPQYTQPFYYPGQMYYPGYGYM
jgi:hypothetical protein